MEKHARSRVKCSGDKGERINGLLVYPQAQGFTPPNKSAVAAADRTLSGGASTVD